MDEDGWAARRREAMENDNQQRALKGRGEGKRKA
jgi:hypothetical protein